MRGNRQRTNLSLAIQRRVDELVEILPDRCEGVRDVNVDNQATARKRKELEPHVSL